MNERGWIEPIVERVVGQVLDSHTAQLRTEIVRRVIQELAAAPELNVPRMDDATLADLSTRTASSASEPAVLARAVAEIQMGSSQREILRALLDISSRYATRVALFVVKGSRATGWEARGFADCEAIKDFVLGESAPAVVSAIRDRIATSATVDDLDSRFLEQVGMPASGEVQILPLILKDKVAALVYADSGADGLGKLEAGSLELLVLSTGAWLEVNSLRKQTQREQLAGPVDREIAAESAAHPTAAPASAYIDPFGSQPVHPGHAMAAAAGEAADRSATLSAKSAIEMPATADRSAQPTGMQNTAAEITAVETAFPALEAGETDIETSSGTGVFQSDLMETGSTLAELPPAIDHQVGQIIGASVDTGGVSATSPADQDVHRKAQRFARLLVDEIKLYNQAKVSEGRNNKDLYDRLKEVIEKSRATYHKRYGSTVAASADYFQHEIIRSLAEDDLSIMGAGFRH
jgi:hypothetical protein